MVKILKLLKGEYMYKIGEFSKLTNLSIRTLRYYNDIGLLIPEEVDIYTGYRYYGDNNLYQVKVIELLKNAGFTLEEIIENQDNFNDDIILKHKQKLYQEINDVQDKIKLTDDLRNQIKDGKIILNKINKNKVIRR